MVNFLLVVIIFFMFLYILSMKQKNSFQQEKYVLEMERKTQKALYRSIESGLEKQRELSHDYMNHIVCIHTMLEQEKYEEAKEYLKKISGIVSHDLDKIDTNHPVVNAIVNAKYQEAMEKNIMVVCRVNDLSGISMEDSDIVLILSNVLNNAIEACEKCDGKRVIRFKFVMEMGNLILSIQNSYDGIVLKRGKAFLTTKKEEDGAHGIGLKNIMKTIETYGGFCSISYDNSEFHVFINIPQTHF